MKIKVGNRYNLHHEDIKGEVELQRITNSQYDCFSKAHNKHFLLTEADFIAALKRFRESESSTIIPDVSLSTTDTTFDDLTLVRKVHKPLGTKTKSEVPQQSDSEFEQMKKAWINDNIDGYNEDYREGLIAKIQSIEINASYYDGSTSYGCTAYIVDGAFAKPHPYRKARKEPNLNQYYFKVRQWDWTTNSWGPLSRRAKGYEYEYEIESFVKDIAFPKLSKTPDLLWKEAEKALENDDVEKYALDQAQAQEADGPNTQLMHVGSKEALAAVQMDLELKRAHAVSIQNTMSMIIEQKKRALERVKDKMNAMLVVFEKQIKKIARVITTIELYLGIEEEIVQIQEGPTATQDDPICIRQGIMYMDEEVGDPWDDGQGLEWDTKGIAAFDDWLTRNNNYKKVIPESKGIAAFQARRNFKKRASYGNPFANLSKMEADMQTFLLIRNGDNLYRLITDKINFRPRLFPKRDELQTLLEYWKVADNIEQQNKNPDAWMSLDHLSEKDKEMFNSFNRRDHRKTSEAKEFAEDSVFFYKMRITLFQGLIDRSTILYPLIPNTEYKLFSPAAQEAGHVRLIYDDELTLPTGRKSFWNWMADLNAKIDYGSRIVLSHNWSYLTTVGTHHEMEKSDFSRSKEIHQDRLDDRYGSGSTGNWSHIPPRPQEGMYFVHKGERWQNEPVWINNPDFNPDLLETPACERYSPTHLRQYWPKFLKTYNRDTHRNREKDYHYELNPRIKMTYAEQITYFGKVVEKGLHPSDHEKNKTGIWIHGILKNPRKIHKCTMVPVTEWKKGKVIETGDLEPEYEYHDVKHNFMCIRYNPKDMVGEYRMIRSRYLDDEPTQRKLNISWKIYNDDAFIINYDGVTVEDIDFYLNSRTDRRHYMFMMPLLMKVRQTLLDERASEVDFKRLVQGEVLRITGILPTELQIDEAVEQWKTNLKWKRAIAHDDTKALRMIVKRLTKLVSQ